MGLSHLDQSGRAKMVDVSEKRPSARMATAQGSVTLSPAAFAAVRDSTIAKGDVLSVARLAGIMGAKRTAELIPLCHPLSLDAIDVGLVLDDRLPGVQVTATARIEARTGVEMEAMVAVSVACLTIYDMVKAVDRSIEIGPIRLLEKRGGKGGDYARASSGRDQP